MIYQKCALCQKSNYRILYKKNFHSRHLNEKIFSARRLPDRIHFQIVKCKKCGLAYSNPIIEYSKLEKLYKKSFIDYDEHIENLKQTYGTYIRALAKYRIKKNSFLEIGCGNGFMLEEAKRQGFKKVYGVEPGKKSVEKAPVSIRKNIKVSILKKGIFKEDFFDVICCFQTFDHVPNPNEFLKECHRILKKGGLILFLHHDVESFSARVLKERSPIIDIEHTYLYSKQTMSQMLKKHNFEVLEVKSASNIHNLGYWLRLFPLPNLFKLFSLRLLKFFQLDQIKIKINPGNIVAVGRK